MARRGFEWVAAYLLRVVQLRESDISDTEVRSRIMEAVRQTVRL